MKYTAIVAILALAACSDTPPTCQEAIENYYGQCGGFVDLRNTPPTPIPAASLVLECRSLHASAYGRCEDALDAWLRCLAGVTSGDCDCVRETEDLSFCR